MTARRPDNIPLICTGAGPIHLVHNQPMSMVCVALFCLGNRYGPGVSSFRHWPGVAGSSPCTLTTSLAIPVPSSSSSNGPTTVTVITMGLYHAAPQRGQVHCLFGLIGEVCPGVEPVDRGQTRSLTIFEPQITITQEMVGRRTRTDDLRKNSPSLDR